MYEDMIISDQNADVAEMLSLMYQRDSRRMSTFIDAQKEVSE